MADVKVLENVSRTLNKVGFTIKKHSPAILIVTGVVGAVTSTVLACKATRKLDEVLEQHKERIEAVKTLEEETKKYDPETYNETEFKQALSLAYVKAGVSVAKLYAPAAVVGVASIVSILASHKILNERHAALASAYAIVDGTFKDYRKRVVDRFGERVDYELRHNIKTEKLETIVLDENGEEKTETKPIDVIQGNVPIYSEYAILFDETNPNWQKDAELNKAFLLQIERFANDKLRLQGHLFLNEVYDMLGHERTKAGNIVGWVYDKDNMVGDNYVSFGIFDVQRRPQNAEFINGYERSVLLDFNVDGNIWELMK